MKWITALKSSRQTLALFSVIAVFAWFLQTRLFLNWDVAYILNSTRLWLAGGTYQNDFFAPNPPMILFLYLPPLLLHQWFHLSLMVLFRLYIFALITLSFAFAVSISQKIFAPKDAALRTIFLAALLVIELMLPNADFGQRDHLLLVFTMPYLLSVAARAQGETPSSPVFIGVLAGLAIALKPQFIILPFFLEIYLICRRKKLFAFCRPEVFAIGGVLFLHLLIILLAFPDFLFVVMPFVLRNYYAGLGQPFAALLFSNKTIFCFFPLVMAALFYPQNPYRRLCAVLSVALCAYLAIYFSQHTFFYYHYIPPFAMALLLQTFLFALWLRQWRDERYGQIMMGLFAAFLVAFLYFQVFSLWTTLIFWPHAFFIYLALVVVLLLLFRSPEGPRLKMLFPALAVFALSYGCYFLAWRTPGYIEHVFLLTVTVAIIAFGCLGKNKNESFQAAALTAFLGLLCFSFPATIVHQAFCRADTYKAMVLNPLSRFMETEPQAVSIYVLSLRGYFGSPLFEYTENRLPQRFDCLWPVLNFVREGARSGLSRQDEERFMTWIAEDLHRHQPALVFVDRNDEIMRQAAPSFNYLTYFSQNEKFREEWKAYRPLTELKNAWYDLEVYTRR